MSHALLAPSSASRWLACTPSARLEEQFPDGAGEAAAEGTLAHVSGRTSLPAYPDGLRKSAEVLAAIADALARCARTMRASIDHADQLGDAGTADLFTGISRELDKRLWFVEAHI